MMKGEWDLPDDRKIHYFEFVRMLFETVEFFSMEENDNVHKTIQILLKFFFFFTDVLKLIFCWPAKFLFHYSF